MKNHHHDTQMEEVYAKIYAGRYDFATSEMEHARYIISKNMRELGLSTEGLKNFNVLNIGTGREVKVFHELGAKNIYHFDISNKSVSALLKLKKENDKFNNIHTSRLDICKMQDLQIKDGIDLVYLSGVLHHLYDPGSALGNIFKVLNHSAKLFFRIYRSGCLMFFMADFIRKFISYSGKDMFDSVFKEKFQDNEINRAFYMVYDNFFVSVLRLYDPKEVDGFFISNGFGVLIQQNFINYDHNDNIDLSGEGISLYYKKNSPSAKEYARNKFPSHVDQMEDIKYKEGYINNTIVLMSEFLKKAGELNQKYKVEIAIDLMRTVKIHRLLNMYNKGLEKEKKSINIGAKDMHREIQGIIKRAL